MSPEETDGVADELLQTGEYAPEDGPEWLNQWKVAPGKYRTRPDVDGLDGFFLMRFRKAS
jgi:16S rRNA C967 or C1407 C5-methylase (RsmB/RsmF family)